MDHELEIILCDTLDCQRIIAHTAGLRSIASPALRQREPCAIFCSTLRSDSIHYKTHRAHMSASFVHTLKLTRQILRTASYIQEPLRHLSILVMSAITHSTPATPTVKVVSKRPMNDTLSNDAATAPAPAPQRQTSQVVIFGKQSSWTPAAIAGIVFGVLMFVLGLVALWQTRNHKILLVAGKCLVAAPHNFR